MAFKPAFEIESEKPDKPSISDRKPDRAFSIGEKDKGFTIGDTDITINTNTQEQFAQSLVDRGAIEPGKKFNWNLTDDLGSLVVKQEDKRKVISKDEMNESEKEVFQKIHKARLERMKGIEVGKKDKESTVSWGETLKYLPSSIWKTIGADKFFSGTARDIKEFGGGEIAKRTLQNIPDAAAGMAKSLVVETPIHFTKSVMALVDEEFAEEAIPEDLPSFDIGKSAQRQHKQNIQEGMDPWFSALQTGSNIILEGAITSQLVSAGLQSVAKKPTKGQRPKWAREQLGVDRGASQQQIKQAYRKAAHQAHPDAGGSKETMTEINKAFEALTGGRPNITRMEEIANILVKERGWSGLGNKPMTSPTQESMSDEVVKRLPADLKDTAISVDSPTAVQPITPTVSTKDTALSALSKELQPFIKEPKVSEELQPLAEEARKYESAEGFINTVGAKNVFPGTQVDRKVFHGTLEQFDKFSPEKAGENTARENAQWGFFFLENQKRAQNFVEDTRLTGDQRSAKIKKAYLDIQNPLDLTYEGLFNKQKQAGDIYEMLNPSKETLPNDQALKWINDNIGLGEIADFYDSIYTDLTNKQFLQNKGYDGIIDEFGRGEEGNVIKEYVAFSPEQIKTETEMQDFYNKVTREAELSLPTKNITNQAKAFWKFAQEQGKIYDDAKALDYAEKLSEGDKITKEDLTEAVRITELENKKPTQLNRMDFTKIFNDTAGTGLKKYQRYKDIGVEAIDKNFGDRVESLRNTIDNLDLTEDTKVSLRKYWQKYEGALTQENIRHLEDATKIAKKLADYDDVSVGEKEMLEGLYLASNGTKPEVIKEGFSTQLQNRIKKSGAMDIIQEREQQLRAEPSPLTEAPSPKVPLSKDQMSGSIKEAVTRVKLKNAEFNRVKNKLMNQGASALKPEEMQTLREGGATHLTPEGEEQMGPGEAAARKLEEMYTGIDVDLPEQLPRTLKSSKANILDKLASEFSRYYGLDEGTQKALTMLEGSNGLRQEELIDYFKEEFPISKEQAERLTLHRENPGKYPLDGELEEYATKVNRLMDLSKKMQESRGLQSNFFPDTFIKRAQQRIEEHQEIIPTLEQESAIQNHREAIETLKEYQDFLEDLRYIPHRYLESEEIQKGALKLLPEGKVSSKFRDTISNLKGRKIDSLDKAEELDLIPEKDIRTLLASHFEYLYRKIAIHDVVEQLKENDAIMKPEMEAPEGWDRLAISQLSDYRVHPLMSKAIEQFTYSYESGIFGQGYDAVNQAGKAIMFHNPIILPFWNVFQGLGTGGFNPLRPFHTTKLLTQASKDVTGKSELYKELVKRKIFRTPLDNRYSPSFEDTMRWQIDRMSDDYPKWKKAVEKITGKKVDKGTYTVLPDAYKANWRLTWFLNRVQRTASVRHALNAGMSIDEAARFANKFHGDYTNLPSKTQKWLNRGFLVPTFKKAMLYELPKYVAKNTFKLAKNVVKGGTGTKEQQQVFLGLWRILMAGATALELAKYKGYHLREGYRLIKKLAEPEITEEGDVLTERVITLPGPFAEWPKLIERLKRGPKGLYMYSAAVPKMAWGLWRNRRWMGDKYYEEGAHPETQVKSTTVGLIRDFFTPIDRWMLMTDEETAAMDNILSQFGIATYKRGSSEGRIIWKIQNARDELIDYLEKPDVSSEKKKKAKKHYENFVEEKLQELEDIQETYEEE